MTQHNDALLDRLFDALRNHPGGATAKEIGIEIDWPQAHTSGRLGKLAMYGMIDRTMRPREGGGRAEYSYRLKEKAFA